ncbi:DDE-type integrase/transposase/recombinase [Pseudomonas sp. KU26590]|uniref:Mu transposase C-terminal domain-containing protein n=1 Tax=Pseudomonas sp. KU26590 TaxID=2991051 RepID=UPI00223DD4D9|nr:Mu transposase C-terminal domain-containing protein [Pseudomonas sp. KU26590]UZJ58072.1 DDE-type integrase/transposase/recombinase [Pseudomonas sp. KU26590]
MLQYIVQGNLVSFEEKTYRVVTCGADGSVTLKSLESEYTFEAPFTQVTLVEIDQHKHDLHNDRRLIWLEQTDVNPKELAIASERAKNINDYLAKKISRAALLEKLDSSETTARRLLKRYDPELGAVSLVRSVRGRKKNSRLLSDIQEKIMEKAITKRIKDKTKKLEAFSSLWEYVDSLCHSMGVKTPSLNALKRRLESYGEKAVYSLQHGREAMLQKFELKPGMIDVETILTMVQIDHTRVDIIICDDQGEPLMRPWLTVVIDLKSRVILGYYLALHPPSAVSVAMALLSACFPKQDFPIALGGGQNTRHRFWGVPHALGMDNAAEFTSPELEATLQYYKIIPMLRPIGKKHYGGHVERIIGTLMGKVHLLPGTTYSNVLKKGEYDSAKNSAITFSAFCEWFAGEVAIYHGRSHEGLNRLAPFEVWDAEMAKKGPNYVPPMSGNFKTFALDFFPSVIRTVQPKGVEFSRAFYSSAILNRLVGRRLSFKYSPLNFSKIWLRQEGRYHEIPYSDLTRAPISYSEYWAFARPRKRRPGALVDEDLHQVRLDNYELVESSKAETKRLRQNMAKKVTAAETMSFLSYGGEGHLLQGDTKEPSPDQTRKKLKWVD